MLSQNIRAMRVHGTLEVELEDGRTATVEVNLDVSSALTAWGIEQIYNSESEGWRTFARPIATKFYVEVPPSLHRDEGHPFVLRIPTDG